MEKLLREAFQLGQQWVQDMNNDEEPISFNEWFEETKTQIDTRKMSSEKQMLLAKFFAERRRMNDNDLDLLYMLDDIYHDNYKRTRDRVEAYLTIIKYVYEIEKKNE